MIWLNYLLRLNFQCCKAICLFFKLSLKNMALSCLEFIFNQKNFNNPLNGNGGNKGSSFVYYATREGNYLAIADIRPNICHNLKALYHC